jgi:2-amino-4-hydroxy-6-hydroxymethyldihydropteridine diphosphokinase
MATCLIALGSNLGDRQRNLETAILHLSRHSQIHQITHSTWVETDPVGGPPGQQQYLNGAAVLETSLDPVALLRVLWTVEAGLGRERQRHWGARTMDLDLLLFDQVVLTTPELVLPHPRMAWRRFVLAPAAQVAPDMVHPTTWWTIGQLLDHLNRTPWYVAITGTIGAGKTELAEQIARKTGPGTLIAEKPDFRQLAEFYRDPSGHAWAMELEFLEARAKMLAATDGPWAGGVGGCLPCEAGKQVCSPYVSDFWFDQSAAFARVWLAPERWNEYAERFERARQSVVRPRLVVLLEAPAAELLRRVRARARPCEQDLTAETLDRIGQAVRRQAGGPGQGPVLRVPDGDRETALAEVLAAVEAMR